MTWLYFILLLVAAGLFLLDAFSSNAIGDRTTRFSVRLLPLGLFFWVLVLIIQTAKAL